jgi:hypothetical protein
MVARESPGTVRAPTTKVSVEPRSLRKSASHARNKMIPLIQDAPLFPTIEEDDDNDVFMEGGDFDSDAGELFEEQAGSGEGDSDDEGELKP